MDPLTPPKELNEDELRQYYETIQKGEFQQGSFAETISKKALEDILNSKGPDQKFTKTPDGQIQVSSPYYEKVKQVLGDKVFNYWIQHHIGMNYLYHFTRPGKFQKTFHDYLKYRTALELFRRHHVKILSSLKRM
eukprot:TRINITY_DN4372_c0_g2_i1.p2 TRINITY_DN4372_c0_g2~~TRINITY_DN4372_c0_g2_i1.p2  ORF type:complete len:135 (-),score=10.44 TRINITY_DN4372_c0_g2_i1:253-657(-)